MDIINFRGSLKRTQQAIAAGQVTLGFVGGSITDPRPEWNWPAPVSAWFAETFPGVRVVVENAAIGATGSDLAVFRAERDLIQRQCDLIFIEFAVNDETAPSEQRRRTREGLIRKLLQEERDVALAYTYSQAMYADMACGRVPATIAEFEQLAQHYALSSVWMGRYALEEMRKGRMRWEEWLPDGLHPQSRGSLSYAQSVIDYLRHELVSEPGQTVIPAGANLSEPLNARHWGNAQILPWSAVRQEGPWQLLRWSKSVWMDQVLHTTAVGARLSFEFTGRGLLLGFDFGKASAEFMYRLDGGEWIYSDRDRPEWCGLEGWYRTFLVADDLPQGQHSFELEVVHGNASGTASASLYAGTTLNLALIGIVP